MGVIEGSMVWGERAMHPHPTIPLEILNPNPKLYIQLTKAHRNVPKWRV